jgi:hypothetical protein
MTRPWFIFERSDGLCQFVSQDGRLSPNQDNLLLVLVSRYINKSMLN